MKTNLFLILFFLQRSLYFGKYDISLHSMGNLGDDFFLRYICHVVTYTAANTYFRIKQFCFGVLYQFI